MTVENLSRAMGGIRLAYIMEAEEYLCTEAVRARRVWRTLLIAAIIVCFMTATAFAVGMFSSVSGDSLSLSAQYLGGGVVELEIENRSADFNDFAGSLVTLHDGEGDEGVLAVVSVDIGAADAHGLDLQQSLLGAVCRHGDFIDFEGFLGNQSDLSHSKIILSYW